MILHSSRVPCVGGLARGKRLGCRDRPFCFSASSMGENPLFSVGLLQWAKWWRQVPLSPNEDRKMGMVERKFIDD